MDGQEKLPAFWAYTPNDIFAKLHTGLAGLSGSDAIMRMPHAGAELNKNNRFKSLLLFAAQFKSPVTVLLMAAAVVSFFLGDKPDTYIIFSIILISGVLGYWQEKGASGAVSKLLALVKLTATVKRDSTEKEIPVDEVVPGDIVLLTAGDIVPCDGLIISSNELFADEAAFTGETFPVEKKPCVIEASAALSKRSNAVFLGSHIVSGSGIIIAVNTGSNTEFGAISKHLESRHPETDFEKGIRRFGYLLMEITLVLVVIILGINLLLKKPVLDSFLFALAIAVGLTPQLLPAIISINLAKGARRMAEVKVIVKKLSAIENFGSMNIFCSDKTGTLTMGKVKVQGTYNTMGEACEETLLYAALNASFQKGFDNPIDDAICEANTQNLQEYTLINEIPYDFIRKRLSILATDGTTCIMICKGALKNIMEICDTAETGNGEIVPIANISAKIEERFESFSAAGFRTLGVAYKRMQNAASITKADEQLMTFKGFVTLYDPPKPGISDTIAKLTAQGIALKIITGDNVLVAKHLGESLGFKNTDVITGDDLHNMSDRALLHRALTVKIFAEIEPNQKERIILALKKSGNVVGYMGDGINDVTALHAADIGISVASAVDIAKGAADIVLLDNDLEVLIKGVNEGRITFANTLKYIFMATSANFGNMFSMSAASAFLSFLPLMPRQILLTNLLTDIPEMTIATDNTDAAMVNKPRKWDIGFIKKFMVTFGLLSSFFDFVTFGVLLLLLHANEQQFQTGWFVESVVSATLIVLVIRTRNFFLKSKPGKYLLLATLAIVIFTLLLPAFPFSGIFDFVPLPAVYYVYIIAVVILYLGVAEIVKAVFYRQLSKKR
ncbi:MAG TPA: magnesium-translocating P-type ATPase [Chitinophagaceae bacterium]|nr:magnesium-translocating P-type ATPase [Chitinophagaceae bacterium]